MWTIVVIVLTREEGDRRLESSPSLNGLIGGLEDAEKLVLAALLAISFALNALTLSSLPSDGGSDVEVAVFADSNAAADADKWMGVISWGGSSEYGAEGDSGITVNSDGFCSWWWGDEVDQSASLRITLGVLEALPGEGEGEECIDSVSDASALSSTLSDSITVPVPARGLDPVPLSFLKFLPCCPLAALLATSFALNALSLSSLPSNAREGEEVGDKDREGAREASGTSKVPGKMARGEGMEGESETDIGAGVMDFATSLRLEEGEGVKGERTLLSA
jgi:hypothetical protein